MPAARPVPRDDEPQEGRPPAPAFSGAVPTYTTPPDLAPSPRPDLAGVPLVLSAAVRKDVVELVGAVLARDRAVAASVVGRLMARGDDEPGLALVAALAPLGERFATLADSDDPVAVLAQGELVALRAESLLGRVAPDAPPQVAGRIVQLACGREPAEQPTGSDEAQDVLVAAVLLAQTVEDGAGDVAALAAEIAELLPDD